MNGICIYCQRKYERGHSPHCYANHLLSLEGVVQQLGWDQDEMEYVIMRDQPLDHRHCMRAMERYLKEEEGDSSYVNATSVTSGQ